MKASSAFLVLALIIAATRAHGATVVINASKDNTIYADDDSLSNGAGQRFFAGKSGGGADRRGLIKFDLGAVPGGASIDSVVLRLNLAQTQLGSRVVSLHRLLADWGEGTSVAGSGEGGGAPATDNDATWTKRFLSGAAWVSAGGDYDSTVSASRPVGGPGAYSWRDAGMTADVVFWLANPAQNHGWAVIGDETVGGFATAKAFNTRQAAISGNRPALVVHYTVPTPAGPLPPGTRLFPVQPNPFNPTATIRYELTRSARVTLDVHDAGGRLVRVLVQMSDMPAGLHQVTWHGDDSRHERVASGVYFARLRVNHEPARVEKMVLVK